MGKRQTNRLNSVAVNAKKAPGYHPDGNGLYLQVSTSGSKSWILRFSLNKRSREMGLGPTTDVTLSEAREQARKYRQLLRDGIDPIEHREKQRLENLVATQQRRSFEECASEYHRLHLHSWKNPKHADQWINTLTTYAFPLFGSKDVSSVSKADILGALEPIWLCKHETATRLRQRIRAVLDWAAARDYRIGHDPHLWDQVARSLPKAKDTSKHFAACPYIEINAALQSIKASGSDDTVKSAIEFLILTASRSGEIRKAVWSEIDFDGNRWIIPGVRMKNGREHRIPLSPRAIEILESLRQNDSPLIFPNKKGKPYSDMTYTALLKRLGHTFTIHGFRSTFRDWSAEQTQFPREVCEAALAHSIKDATEAAYFRSDLFEKRRQLMEAWATYCTTPMTAGQVVPISSTKNAA